MLRHYGLDVSWSSPHEADLVSVGSVLAWMGSGTKATILGTGFIQEGETVDLSQARVLAVRGVLTREAALLPPSTPLGDLGILSDRLVNSSPDRQGLVIVPHYADPGLALRYPEGRVVDVLDDPLVVIRQIVSGKRVITSSLHGLIVADAFGIPHTLEPCEYVTGGLFKFQDYVSAFGESIHFGVERLTGRSAMAERQSNLEDLVRSLL